MNTSDNGPVCAQRLAFTSLKAFGDFTITVSALRCLPADVATRVSLLFGEHLRELSRVLQPHCEFQVLDSKDLRVPALFDVRIRGLYEGARSAWQLRKALADVDDTATLVFDRITWRERLIAKRRPLISLPSTESNIYHAYDRLLRETFSGRAWPKVAPLQPGTQGRRVGLFPGSRIPSKVIPTALTQKIAQKCSAMAFEPIVFELDGEAQMQPPGVRVELLPRQFSALARALKSVDVVVSADSLPAHLGAFFKKPVYVATPVPNTYWFPARVYENDDWGVFSAPNELCTSLEGFLRSMQ